MSTPSKAAFGKVAIVSASLRLPGADFLASFWDSLLQGGDSITRAADATPNPEQTLERPSNGRYVSAYGRINGATAFDHERFGMSAAEAMLTDPQQRLLLELVDEALYRAALSSSQRATAAVFVGTGLNGYASVVHRHMATTVGVDDIAVELGTARDYVAGKVAYRLDLRGLAVNVLAACSTGLLAIHLGRRSLLSADCDVAIAGVATLRYPECRGYWAVPGSISSPDGVCRPFDTRAAGTVPADGACVVVLKRLDDALAAGDEILAVIRGSAANNDGRKFGFANVSMVCQERVITTALREAEVEPGDVGYVESHGTATRLGDAVEWSALQKVFGRNDAPIYIGAVKGNVGHTREAAGLAGLLKAIMSLRHGRIPATVNFELLPRDLDHPNSPVKPVAAPTPFDASRGGTIVGVSAFGLGGTNCHVVLEAAPARPDPLMGNRGTILLSTHRQDTLDADTDALRHLLDAQPDMVARLAARSQSSHHAHTQRRYLGLGSGDSRPEAFSTGVLERRTRRVPKRPVKVAFAFSGLGSEYLGMSAGLAQRYDVFRRSRDDVAEMAAALGVDITGVFVTVAPHATTGGTDLRQMLGRGKGKPRAAGPLEDIAVCHLSLFAIQIALLDLFADASIHPSAVVGHSIGEWTAATAAGSLTRLEAVRLIARRAKLIEQTPGGVTLAVAARADAVTALLSDGVALAADNSPQSCAASGPLEAVQALEQRLREAGIVFRRLRTRGAFHTPQLRGSAGELRRVVEGLTFSDPAIPMASSVTGSWIRAGQLNAAYWELQLTSPVQFRRALQTIGASHDAIVELGPGNVRPWVLQLGGNLEAIRTFPLSFECVEEVEIYEQALAELWLRGHHPIWPIQSSDRPRPAFDIPPPTLRRTVFDPSSEAAFAQQRISAVTDPVPVVAPIAGAPTRKVKSKPDSSHTPPKLGELTDKLAGMWCALLGLREVTDDDDFFEIGGDSLLGGHLIASIENLYGVGIPGSIVFTSGSLRGMAASVHKWIVTEGPTNG